MELHRSIRSFFHEAVVDALKAQGVAAAEPTEFYLVNLLCAYMHAEQLDEEPLALKLAQASTATPETRARVLKEVGDTSLYVSGFFADSLTRKLVDVDYYMTLGGSAYGQLAGMTTSTRTTELFHEAYDELAEKFARFVAVLNEIRSRTNFATPSTNLIRLYEEWVRTGSEWLEKRLKATGVFSLDAVTGPKLPH